MNSFIVMHHTGMNKKVKNSKADTLFRGGVRRPTSFLDIKTNKKVEN